MPTEGFFSRWSRLKTEPAPEAPVAGAAAAAGGAAPSASRAAYAGQDGQARQTGQAGQALLPRGTEHGAGREPASGPTLEDVAQLGADSDYSIFVARGVDTSVRRSAMKKLFSDPHFNIGDGLDLYMGDYNKPDPIPAAMMSALRHTESFFAQAYPERQAEKEREARAESGIERAGADQAIAAGVTAGRAGDEEVAPGATATTGAAADAADVDSGDAPGAADRPQPALAVPAGSEENESGEIANRGSAHNGDAVMQPQHPACHTNPTWN